VNSSYQSESNEANHPDTADKAGIPTTHTRSKDPLFRRGDHKRKGKFRIWSKIKSIFGFLIIFSITFFTIYFVFIQPSYLVTQFDYYFGDNREFEKVENSLISLQDKPDLIEDIERGVVNKDEYILDDESPAIITPEEDFTRNRIVIPSLKIDAPIVTTRNSGVSDNDIEEALQRGVLHYPGMANPGELGNVFMTGHTSNYWWEEGDYNNVFATLVHAKENDRIIVYFNQKKYVYRIARKFEVGPNDTWVLKQNPRGVEDAESVLSLMTCTPPGTNLRRLIVWAEEDPEFMQVTEGEYTDSGVPGTDRLISPL
jgi:LPXTG-site transpeptidase (sortase) family protein